MSGLFQNSKSVPTIILIVAMILFMYFISIRPQRKKQKAEEDLRNSIQIGDEVTTIGGIIGRVVSLKDDALIIETGADRSKMKITRWAVSTNNTQNEKAEAERAAAKEANENAKQERIRVAQEKAEAKKNKKNK